MADVLCVSPAERGGPTGTFRLHRAGRHDSGFWTEPPSPCGALTHVLVPEFDLDLDLEVTGELLVDDDVQWRKGAAWVRRHLSRKVLGVAEFQLLQNPGRRVDDDTFVMTAGELSREAFDFTYRLATHFSPISRLFDVDRSMVYFQRLELFPTVLTKASGAKLGLVLMKHLERQYGAGLFVFEPLPMQYRTCGATDCPDPGEVRDEYRFELAKAKLKAHYQKHWGANELSDELMFCSSRNEFAYSERTRSWSFVSRRG